DPRPGRRAGPRAGGGPLMGARSPRIPVTPGGRPLRPTAPPNPTTIWARSPARRAARVCGRGLPRAPARRPEARFPDAEVTLLDREVGESDIAHVVDQIGSFGDDNRAGMERTPHRISACRNRGGKIVGLTLRIGRAVYGTIEIINDFVE